MAIDAKSKAINEASGPALSVIKQLRTISSKIITPIVKGEAEDGSEDINISAATIAKIKDKVTETDGLKDQWEAARDAMDAAFLV